MGIDVIPTPPGNDCLACFDAGETPSFVYVMFEGVKQGDIPGAKNPPNGTVFRCEQDPGNACLFVSPRVGENWWAQFYRSVMTGRWHMTLNYGATGYFTGWNPGCPTEHQITTNLYWSPIFWNGWDGSGVVWWMSAAVGLLLAWGIDDEDDTFMEFLLIDELTPVYKFCNIRLRMNQCFVLTP